jgi:hypothetical protein
VWSQGKKKKKKSAGAHLHHIPSLRMCGAQEKLYFYPYYNLFLLLSTVILIFVVALSTGLSINFSKIGLELPFSSFCFLPQFMGPT